MHRGDRRVSRWSGFALDQAVINFGSAGGSVIYNYSPMKFYNGDSKSIATLLGNQLDGYDYSWKITVDGKTSNGTFNLNVMKGDPQDVLYRISTDKVKATVLLDYQ